MNIHATEIPAPGIQWGALAYPDQIPMLATGLPIFRFTEFISAGERFNLNPAVVGGVRPSAAVTRQVWEDSRREASGVNGMAPSVIPASG